MPKSSSSADPSKSPFLDPRIRVVARAERIDPDHDVRVPSLVKMKDDARPHPYEMSKLKSPFFVRASGRTVLRVQLLSPFREPITERVQHVLVFTAVAVTVWLLLYLIASYARQDFQQINVGLLLVLAAGSGILGWFTSSIERLSEKIRSRANQSHQYILDIRTQAPKMQLTYIEIAREHRVADIADTLRIVVADAIERKDIVLCLALGLHEREAMDAAGLQLLFETDFSGFYSTPGQVQRLAGVLEPGAQSHSKASR